MCFHFSWLFLNRHTWICIVWNNAVRYRLAGRRHQKGKMNSNCSQCAVGRHCHVPQPLHREPLLQRFPGAFLSRLWGQPVLHYPSFSLPTCALSTATSSHYSSALANTRPPVHPRHPSPNTENRYMLFIVLFLKQDAQPLTARLLHTQW